MSPLPRTILLTGATGYVGGRLRKYLEERGLRLRCMARRVEFLKPRVGRDTEVVCGDAIDYEQVLDACKDVDVAIYLVHSMGAAGSFLEIDRVAARNFSRAARDAGVKKIVYLGALGEEGHVSEHLYSRQEVGRILRASGVPTIEFRASVIVGSGSLIYEMTRTLVRRLPVMVAPKWLNTLTQPISVRDVLKYLYRAIDHPITESVVYEIGGAEQISYAEMMREYARQRGLKRIMIPVPFLTPRLSNFFISVVTPLDWTIGRKIVDSARFPTIVSTNEAAETFGVSPVGIKETIARALVREDMEFLETRWSDALSSTEKPRHWGGVRYGNRLIDSRDITVACSPASAFVPIRKIGGSRGWYVGNWLWRMRGFMDVLAGGPGLGRGRRDTSHLAAGDVLDFWRVERVEVDRLLILKAELKLPGRGWLMYEIDEIEGGSKITQTAVFDPVGTIGLAYWYALDPFHKVIFSRLLKEIARRAVTRQSGVSQAV